MTRSKFRYAVRVCVVLSIYSVTSSDAAEDANVGSTGTFRGRLVAADMVTKNRLREFEQDQITAVALQIRGSSLMQINAERHAAQLIAASPLQLYYWIEVARCPELADEQPQLMASLQTHDQWRRYFPTAPKLAGDEVAKTYPWVPVLSRESFAAQLDRVTELVDRRPKPVGVFLNDLQGGPSACGCGNSLCRWTSDYGPRRTTVPLGDDAATLFVSAVRKIVPNASVIPVWTTECERHDGAEDGMCAGVGCFDGICWKAYTRQLMPLQQSCGELAVLCPFREFERDLPIYGTKAGWVKHAIESFAKIPPQHGGERVEPSRLIAVLQAWDVTPEEIQAQIRMANSAGARGYLIADAPIEQSWQPKIVRWK